jgi:hypothetical protein
MRHAEGCQVVRENGIAVWMCSIGCPAMSEFIRSGQCDDQPWDQLDEDQRQTVIDAASERMLAALVARDEEDKR